MGERVVIRTTGDESLGRLSSKAANHMTANPDTAALVLWYAAFLFSIVLHEAAHAWAALQLGDPTAYRGGQVTLNPLPHLKREPVGMIAVPVLTFLSLGWMCGWASASYNALWAQRFPKRAAKMALAGPVSNLLVVCVVAVVIRAGVALEIFHTPAAVTCVFTQIVAAAPGSIASDAALFLSILFSLNVLLFVFNLFPMPPLDGGAILPLFLDPVNARRYMTFMGQPMVSIAGLVAACWAFPYLFGPVFSLALRLI